MERIRRNVYKNIRLGVEQLNFHLPQNTPIVLCAGGPSLRPNLDEVRRLQLEDSAEVVCVGNAAHLLAASGIKVNGHILMDGVERNRTFVVPVKDCRYFVASQCDPSVFEALRFHKHCYIWHAKGPTGVEEILKQYYGPRGFWMVPGGSYISLRAIPLLTILGYQYIHIYGFDSCYGEDGHHSYPQASQDSQVVENVTVGSKDFKCAFWMLDQATQFCEMAREGVFGPAKLAVHGDGLISHMIESGSGPTWRLE
jgi:hypothetical protein